MSVYLKMVERWDVSRIAFESIDTDQQSYAELHQQVQNTVAWLRSQGLTEGDVLCVQLPKIASIIAVVARKFSDGCGHSPFE